MNVTLFQHISIHPPSTKKQPIPPPEVQHSPRKLVVGRLLSFWDCLSSGAMLIFGCPKSSRLGTSVLRCGGTKTSTICGRSALSASGRSDVHSGKTTKVKVIGDFKNAWVFDRETSFKKNGHELKLEFGMFCQQYSWEPKGTPPMPCKTPKK